MADLVAIATGNLTAAATWGLVDTTSKLVSTNTGVTALTTGNLDSATFTPGAITVAGVAVRLGARATGAPTNTITVTLRNSTGAVNIASVTANVSDLPAATSGADSEGGWHYFKFNGTFLLLAATNYLIRATLSSTSTAVSLCTNGTANNWQRLLVTTTTQAPAAGDDMYMAQTLDGAATPATVTARTITMNQTAATDYGTAIVSVYQMAVSVSKACTFSYGVAAATNYLMRISGSLGIYSGGTMNIGSSGAEIPRDSTAILEFDNASDGQFGYRVLNGGILNAYGLSRTAAKEIWYTLLSADEAVASTTIDVAADTGWLNGDEVIIASTTKTAAQTETRTLNANAGASSFTISAGLTNAHSGSGDYFAEVVLLTRNVEIRSVSSTFMMYANHLPTSTVSFSWMRHRYYSSASGGGFWTISTTTGSFVARKCVFRDGDRGITTAGAANANWTFDQCVVYNTVAANGLNIIATTGTWTLTDVMFIAATTVAFGDIGGTIGNLWFISSNFPLTWDETQNNAGTNGPTFPVNTVWTAHSNGSGATDRVMGITDDIQDITFPTFYFWKNNSGSIELDATFGLSNVQFTGNFFGNGVSTALDEPGCFLATRDNAINELRFVNCNISGDTVLASNWGVLFDAFSVSATEVRFENCKFSENTGTRRPLLVADIGCIPDQESGGMLVQGIAEWCTFGAPESIKFYLASGPAPKLCSKYSYILCPGYNQVAADHRVYTPYGTFIRDTAVFDVAPASQNVKPIAGLTLGVDSNAFRRGTGFMAAVASGATITPSVRVEIDGTYNGTTKPQLILQKNIALGIASDTVLATHSGATGAFETLSGTTAAAAADGVFEFVVRCYGTAGNAYVDTWSTLVNSDDTTGDKFWNGQPTTYPNTSPAAGGGGATGAAYVG